MAERKVPVLAAMAYPDNLGGIPFRAFIVSTVVFGAVAIVVKDWWDGLFMLVLLGSWAWFLAYCRRRYRIDPHVEKIWAASIFAARRWPFQWTRNIVPVKGTYYES
jgi:type IV secretory pathway TrbD component|tara:strand:- start:1782 stop:2099 length:318 start_codon:yes stop_codon:yes gene_type:complete